MFLAVFPNSEDTIASNLAITKGNPICSEIYLATVVFPHPGFPYNNKELEDKPYYLEYMEETREEAYKAIQNKFTMSQPLKVTNDHKVFIIFRGNVDMRDVKTFCKMMLQELEYFTEGVHKADYAELETMFMEIGRAPTFMKASKVGEKLTQTDILDKIMVRMDGHDQPQDNGCLTPYTDYVDFKEEEKRQNLKKEELEEIVEW